MQSVYVPVGNMAYLWRIANTA